MLIYKEYFALCVTIFLQKRCGLSVPSHTVFLKIKKIKKFALKDLIPFLGPKLFHLFFFCSENVFRREYFRRNFGSWSNLSFVHYVKWGHLFVNLENWNHKLIRIFISPQILEIYMNIYITPYKGIIVSVYSPEMKEIRYTWFTFTTETKRKDFILHTGFFDRFFKRLMSAIDEVARCL